MDFSWLAPEAEGSHTTPGGIQVSSYPRLLVRAFSNPHVAITKMISILTEDCKCLVPINLPPACGMGWTLQDESHACTSQ